MEIKKNPKSNLENYKMNLFFVGLLLALFVTYAGIEHKTYDKTYDDLGAANLGKDVEDNTIMLTPPPPPPPQPKAPPPPTPEKIEVVEDKEEIEEEIFKSTDTDETEAVNPEKIDEFKEEEKIVEDVPFSIIEEVPVFPGCKGTKAQKKACLNKKMKKHVSRHFDADLANELGLRSGRQRIFLVFKIDKDGSVTSINARAPHPRLKKEAIRIAKKLPRMKPGKQRGKPVRVGYTLPIVFNVE